MVTPEKRGARGGICFAVVAPAAATANANINIRSNRRRIIILNTDGAQTVYVDYSSASISLATSFPILPGQSLTIESAAPLWLLASGAGANCRCITEEDLGAS